MFEQGKISNPVNSTLPNGATMESSQTADVSIPELNAAASKAHVFPGMANHSLLSVGQVCNEGYIVTFKNASVTVCNSQEFQILSGPQDLNTGLWRINLKQDNQHVQQAVSNNVYELRNTGALVHYLHKALFSPTKSAYRDLARPNRGGNPQTLETSRGPRRTSQHSKC
jgi:hypothetical protein